MRFVIDTDKHEVEVDGKPTQKYHVASPLGAAIRVVEKLVKLYDKLDDYSRPV